jgi:Ring finger domain
MPFERQYDDCFLDSLHNHLPELLYGAPEQFGGGAPIVSYIQSQAQRRMDLFSAARRTYTAQVPQTPLRPLTRATASAATQEPHTVPQRDTAQILARTLFAALNTGSPTYEFMAAPTYDIDMVRTIYRMPEDVVVHPTAEQIAAGTQIEIVDADEEICTICQDRMAPGSEARAIRVCDHRFHTECIDTWFQRSVICPTCRHDVREPEPEPSAM